MAIVSHYQSSPEPAKFRGRSSWLSFSGRDRLTNVTPSTDSPTPVLQVNVINIQVRRQGGMRGGERRRVVQGDRAGNCRGRRCSQARPTCTGHPRCLPLSFAPAPPCPRCLPSLPRPCRQPDLAQAVTLDLLNSVFGAHGFVKKLVTYAKPEGGVVAWVQFPDAQTAATVGGRLGRARVGAYRRCSSLPPGGSWWTPPAASAAAALSKLAPAELLRCARLGAGAQHAAGAAHPAASSQRPPQPASA